MVEHNQSANNPTNGGYNNAYKFNGKELDDATGMYYYGARYYDPRISIFVSVDPLAEKTMTPYQYVTNNPVNAIDPNGKHGIRIVDRENKTITVKANYYVQTQARASDYNGGSSPGYSQTGIDILNREVNAAFNSAAMVISEGEYKGYSVNFDLQFIDGGSVENAMQLARTDMYEYNGQSYNIGNSYSRWDDTEPKFRESVNGDKASHVGGYVEKNQFLTMNVKSEGSVRTNKKIWHELLHTFGRKDHPRDKKGTMNYPPGYFSQDDVNFFGNEGIHKSDLAPAARENRILPIVE